MKFLIIIPFISIFFLGYALGALNEFYKSKKEINMLANLINEKK